MLLEHSPGERKDDELESVAIPGRAANINWHYDEEADVLYISVGEPKPSLGIDAGEGVIVRYNEVRTEVVGLTIIGLRARVLSGPLMILRVSAPPCLRVRLSPRPPTPPVLELRVLRNEEDPAT